MPISEHVPNVLSPKIDGTLPARRRLAGPGDGKLMVKTIAAALIVSGSVFVTTGDSLAASPAYCALYAREYANGRIGTPRTGDAISALQRIQDQAYYRCLNMDEEPDFPASSVYFGAAVEEIVGAIGGPFEPIGEGDASLDDEVEIPADEAPAPKIKPAPRVEQTRTASEKTAWTPEWKNWCAAHYRSFNRETGLVLTFSGERKLCP